VIFLLVKLAGAQIKRLLNDDLFVWGFICGEIFIAIIYNITEALGYKP